MGRGKFKGKPTGRRQFSTPEEMIAGSSARRPRTFKQEEAEIEEDERSEESEEESEDDSNGEARVRLTHGVAKSEVIFVQKRKGTQGIIEIENPNLVKPKNVKAKNVDIEKTTELSRREREEIEKQQAHERYMRLQEQGKTEQARKDLERLALIRQQRADAAKKREEEKAGTVLYTNASSLRFSSLFARVNVCIVPVQPKNRRNRKLAMFDWLLSENMISRSLMMTDKANFFILRSANFFILRAALSRYDLAVSTCSSQAFAI
ncbi:28 kDa heat- and acid-stable phosphoprotein [Capsicum annuum]|nr:28 kDa heat- and acid-stable phosphoprotein [Capsicum annuum]